MTREQALWAFWRAFVEACVDGGTWGTGDIDSEPLWDMAVKTGLAEEVVYDPERHGESGEDVEPGDTIWRVTPLGGVEIPAPPPVPHA